jgi:Tfp pilus assembly protein PilX
MVMTIIGVSAVKVSSTDILIAGNEQDQMILFQNTETLLNLLATPERLFVPLVQASFVNNLYKNTHGETTETITDTKKEYSCEGIKGRAVEIGLGKSKCHLYDFAVNARKQSMGTRDVHHRGKGKEKASTSLHSSLN